MHADKEQADWQIDRSIKLCGNSRNAIALTDELVQGSEEAIRSSRALLKRTAHWLP